VEGEEERNKIINGNAVERMCDEITKKEPEEMIALIVQFW